MEWSRRQDKTQRTELRWAAPPVERWWSSSVEQRWRASKGSGGGLCGVERGARGAPGEKTTQVVVVVVVAVFESNQNRKFYLYVKYQRENGEHKNFYLFFVSFPCPSILTQLTFTASVPCSPFPSDPHPSLLIGILPLEPFWMFWPIIKRSSPHLPLVMWRLVRNFCAIEYILVNFDPLAENGWFIISVTFKSQGCSLNFSLFSIQMIWDVQ